MIKFAFKTPVQIERNGNKVSLVTADAFILCNMEDDSDIDVNLRDAKDICEAINQYGKLTEALAYCLPRLPLHLFDHLKVEKYFELLGQPKHDKDHHDPTP